MCAGALLIAAACGDSSPNKPSDGGNPDQLILDTTPGDGIQLNDVTVDGIAPDNDVPTCDPTIIGKQCTMNGGECGQNGTCLLTSQTQGGVCGCQCTPDDVSTPLVNEDSCPNPTQNTCGSVSLTDGTTLNMCFKVCQPKLGSNDCTAPFACSPRSASSSGAIDKAVCLSFGCTQDSDCPVTTATTCDTSASPSTCPTGQECLPLSSSGTAGLCAKPGKCDTASGLCAGHPTDANANAKIGDACTQDSDCGQYMNCQIQLDRKTLLGQKDHDAACTSDDDCCGTCESGKCEGTCKIDSRNGYCTISGCSFASATAYSEFQCPTGSTCNGIFFGGLCMKDCDLATAADCRGNTSDQYGDYECYAWNNLSVGGVPVAANPVCSFSIAPCDIFGQNMTLDCTSLGNMNNPTNMVCRSLATKAATTNPRDPSGFCLDDTASGN